MTKCSTGKLRYSTETNAMIALYKTRRKDRQEQRYYFCTKCKGFHLTSQEYKPNG